jgi:type II secretory pathway pseudopilin PulG
MIVPGARTRGLTAIDVLVVLVLIGILALVLLMAVPRGREQARLAACRKNLSQIGLALALYDQMERSLPVIGLPAGVDPSDRTGSPGPLKILLETLGLADFTALAPGARMPAPSGPPPGEIPVAGFVCASDPNATASAFRAPISYRAATGDDASGANGVFSPDSKASITKVEAGDGAGFTAAFSERFVGDTFPDHLSPANFAVVPGPLPLQGCTLLWLKDQHARWRGDAGSSWVWADYRSTLYNHGLQPDAPLSCMAADGTAAFMGASSGHVRGVNLLMLDASVKLVLPTIDRRVWKEFAAVSDPGTPP